MRSYLADLKARLVPKENPYFRALRDGTFDRADFVETQIQFFFAVVFFSRPMAALVGRLPHPEMRWALLDNIRDEHGDGDLSMSHERTFLSLLSQFGISSSDVEKRALWPEVRSFNTALAGVCTLDDPLTSLAVLGVIEDLFSGISLEIGHSIVQCGWLSECDVRHYPTHEKLDVLHAEGFYRQLDGPYSESARAAYQIQQGLELGAYIFLRLYEDLHRARSRRYLRAVGGPHSLTDGWYLDQRAVPAGGF